MPELDLIYELRLRRWARENYQPIADRSATLHPVALAEMLLRDTEMLEAPAAQPSAFAAGDAPEWALGDAFEQTTDATVWSNNPFVPLLPGIYHIDAAHAGPAAPNYLTLPTRNTADVPEWGLYAG